MRRFFSFVFTVLMLCGAAAELKYVEIGARQNLPMIRIKSIDDFETIINTYNISLVFLQSNSGRTNEAFVMAENTYFVFELDGYKTLADYRAGNAALFRTAEDYGKAKALGIEKSDFYYYYARNSFKSVEDAKDAQKKGFDKSIDYYSAKQLGFANYTDYSEYLFYTANGFKSRDEYLLAKSKGFSQADMFKMASEAGFLNYDEYRRAEQFGLKTKSDLVAFNEITGAIDTIAATRKLNKEQSALFYYLALLPKSEKAVSALSNPLNSLYMAHSAEVRAALGQYVYGSSSWSYSYGGTKKIGTIFSEPFLKKFFSQVDVSDIGSYSEESEIFKRNGSKPSFAETKKTAAVIPPAKSGKSAKKSISQEAAATAGQVVYWTEHGKKFHTHEDCQALNQTETLITGSAQEAMDAGKGTICKFCEKRDSAALEAAQASIDAQAAVNQ